MSLETRSATSEVEFKASVKHFLQRYASELGSAKFLVLLLVKYCLDVILDVASLDIVSVRNVNCF